MKKNRTTKWIESRLWNAKFENNKVTTKDIIIELQSLLGIYVDKSSLNKLKRDIKLIRDRVQKKFSRHLKIAEELSRLHHTEMRLFLRWDRAGLVNLGNRYEVDRLIKIIIERDYCVFVKPDYISLDINMNLWDY